MLTTLEANKCFFVYTTTTTAKSFTTEAPVLWKATGISQSMSTNYRIIVHHVSSAIKFSLYTAYFLQLMDEKLTHGPNRQLQKLSMGSWGRLLSGGSTA